MGKVEFSLPNHIAIIPDGNRRWAKENGLKPWEGHKEGADRIEELVREALNLGVKYLTFWGSSVDNLTKRSFQEKKALLGIYEEYFQKLIDSKEVYESEAKIIILGDWKNQFPQKLKDILEDGIEKTKNHSRHVLCFLLAYNGDEDMLLAFKKLVQKAQETKEKIKVTKELITENLMTAQLPEVDFLIRTGVDGDPHNSAGFLMWQTQNTQYEFSSAKFPTYTKEKFTEALKKNSLRLRRRGK